MTEAHALREQAQVARAYRVARILGVQAMTARQVAREARLARDGPGTTTSALEWLRDAERLGFVERVVIPKQTRTGWKSLLPIGGKTP